MKLRFLTMFLAIVLSIANSRAQDTIKVRQCAQVMVDAFMKSDIDVFMDYTYPKIIVMAGGKDKMRASVEEAMEELKAKGLTFRSVTLGPVSKIYKAGSELHCSMTQYLSMNVPGGYMTNSSPLLGISADGGKSWTFISAGNRDEQKLKLLFPEFNPELVLEAETPTVFHKD